MNKFDLFDRTPRPIGRHLGWVFMLGGIIFLACAGGIFLYAMKQWADGRLAIDWAAIGMLITAMGGAAMTITNIVNNLNNRRSDERIEQIRARQEPPPLAVPSSASSEVPGGGLVNNSAIGEP